MNNLCDHYRLLLGLDGSWQVVSVDLALEKRRVEICVEHGGSGLSCPECGEGCSLADHAPQRQWRHLDTMQFETVIVSSVPRTRCKTCGVKTVAVPWAGKHSRFTLMFEAFAIQVLMASSSVQRAAGLLNLDWKAAHAIMQRGVERGLERRSLDEVRNVGIDEKNFGRGQDYVSVMTDIDGSRVLEVVPGRTEESAAELWETLPEGQRKQVQAVCMDMWQAYVGATEKMAPRAKIVHDRYHTAQHLNQAVDQVRRAEQKKLLREGDRRLTGTRQLWLFSEENVPNGRHGEFRQLQTLNLKTSRAWAIKEQFRTFWSYSYAGHARRFFQQWYGWAARSQLAPIIKRARMLKKHLDRLLTWFEHPISNATSEAYNSRIQWLKSSARGFRNFDNYRTRILFFCGKLNLLPDGTCH
jgi:transposase